MEFGSADSVRVHSIHGVVVHHRGHDLLEACLSSLIKSTDVELDIALVLNGCDESLPEVVGDSDRIHVVRLPKPVGFAEANNRGVAWAREHLGVPDAYYFVNNDTVSDPQALQFLAQCLNDDPRVAVAGPRLMIEWARDHLNSLGLNVTEDGWGWDEGIGIVLADYGSLPGRREVLAVTGSALLISTRALDRVGGWTELYEYYFEDIDLCLKVRRCGWSVVNEPGAVVFHHVSATTAVDSEWKRFLFLRNRLLMALVHWPWSLLRTVIARVAIDEILAQPWPDSTLQRRALGSVIRRLPKALWLRTRAPGKHSGWRELLVPAGSVPTIGLPEPASQPAAAERPSTRAESWQPLVRSLEDRVREQPPPSVTGRRVVVVGCAPLPWEDARMNFAPGARTWQLVRGLADDGHQVLAVCGRIPGAYANDPWRPEICERNGVQIVRLDDKDFFWGGALSELIEAFAPDCLVGASARPSARALEVAGGRPVWVDLFGDPMGEAQARATVYGGGNQLTAHRNMLAALLEGGDAFSVVSTRQRFAVLGQLGLAGRLNRQTAGHELVFVVPCSLPEQEIRVALTRSSGAATAFGGHTFVVLWGGSFNTWCDIRTLIDGLERAMAQNPAIQLVSTGGEIAGHDERSYRSFLAAVARSRFAHRFSHQGALPTRHALSWIARADLGIVTESRLVERELGSSGRMLAWLGLELPLVCTAQSEIGSCLIHEGLALGYRTGDPDDLARVIVEAAADRPRLREMAARAREWTGRRWSIEDTTAPLRDWIRTAALAPDRGTANGISIANLGCRLAQVEAERDELRAQAEAAEARYHQVRAGLGSIHQSAMWRTWTVLRSLRRALLSPFGHLRRGL